MIPRVLIVDSDPQYRRWLSLHLQSAWPDATPECRSPEELAALLPTLATQPFDAVLLGARFDAADDDRCEGYDWLRRLHRRARRLPVIALATGGNELTAVRSLRLGAADYLPREGLDPALLERRLRRIVRRAQRKSGLGAGRSHRPGRQGRTARIGRADRRYREARAARTIPVAAPVRIDLAPPLTAAAAAPPALPVLAPRAIPGLPQIPNYTPIHQIGDSSRASVWLAHSDLLGRQVALKISKPPTGTDDDNAQSFSREYAALSALRHPGVVQIFEYGVHAQCEFLAMEYFPCGDLKFRLQQPITPQQSIEYVRRIAMALQPVHDAGLMHRDLKPPNVMLRPDCSVVLIDFGLAKRQNAATASTELGIRRGSPYYMSPEQVQGLPLDSRSDLYSLGVIFYEMLTGRKPYTGATAIELMERHVEGGRPPLPAELSHFEPLLQSMMAIEREDRIANAGALLELLRDYQPAHFDLATAENAHAG